MRLAAILSCRHPLGADSAGALDADRELVRILRESADVLVLEQVSTDLPNWNLSGIAYAAYLAECAAPLACVVRGLPLGVCNPVDLAEALATLDHAWAGRFAAGLVQATPRMLAEHGKDPLLMATRFDEALAILDRMWAGKPFAAQGHAYRFSEVQPTLLPYTAGGPDLSLSVTDQAGAALAARHGLGLHLPCSVRASRGQLIRSYQLAGGVGQVSVEVEATEPVGSTALELGDLGVTQVDLRLPSPSSGQDPIAAWVGHATAVRSGMSEGS